MALPAKVIESIRVQLSSGSGWNASEAPFPPVQAHVWNEALRVQETFGAPKFWAGWRPARFDSIANGDHPAGLAIDYYINSWKADGQTWWDLDAGAKLATYYAKHQSTRYVIWNGFILVCARYNTNTNRFYQVSNPTWVPYVQAGESNHLNHVHWSSLPAGVLYPAIERPVHPLFTDGQVVIPDITPPTPAILTPPVQPELPFQTEEDNMVIVYINDTYDRIELWDPATNTRRWVSDIEELNLLVEAGVKTAINPLHRSEAQLLSIRRVA